MPVEMREQLRLAVGDLFEATLQTYEGITILTPEVFMALLRERGRLHP